MVVITGSDHVSQINCSLVYLHHPSCLCVGLQEAELQVGLQLPVLALSEEEGGRSGGGCSYIALWRAGFASLFPWQRLSYSIQLWDSLCIWKRFPVVSQWPSVSSSAGSLLPPPPPPLLSADALKAALHLHFQITHHSHLTQGWNSRDYTSEPVANTLLDVFKWALSALFAGNLPINLPQILSFMNMHMHT